MTTNRIAELEQALQRERVHAVAQKRGKQVELLREIVRELDESEPALAQIERTVALENQVFLDFNRRIIDAQVAVADSLAHRPTAARWLTSAESMEVRDWEREHKKCTDTLARIISERDSLPKVDRQAAVQLANRVSYLRASKRNICNALDGSINKLKGGIFPVA